MLWLIQRQLKSKKVEVRRKAVERLGLAPEPRVLDALRFALDDEDAEVRRLAATALGQVEDDGRIEPLIKALRDRNFEVVHAAISGLKRDSGEQVLAALAPLVRHGDAAIRAQAAQALETAGWRPADAEEEAWFLVARGQFHRVASLGAVAVPALETAISSGSSSTTVGAVKALGAIGGQRAQRTLLAAMKSSDASVCIAALDTLTKTSGPEIIEPLTSLLRHPNGHVRGAAAEALGSLNAVSAVEPLRALLRDGLWDVRRAAAEALGKLKDGRSVEALTRTLDDGDADVREATAMALGNVADRRSIGPLVLALKDSNSSVRRIVSAALARIDEDWSSTPEARQAASQLKSGLEEKEAHVRHFVGQLLVSLGESEPAIPQWQAPSEDASSSPAKRRKLAVSLFVAVLCDEDRDLRQAAAEALGRLGDERALSALGRCLGDHDTGVREAVEHAMQALGGKT